MPVRQPGQLGGELVLLAERGIDADREAAVEPPGHTPFDAADMIDIGDHPLADAGRDRRDDRSAAGRHIDGLAGIFPTVLEHEATEERHGDTLEPPPVLSTHQ